jgi:hypothetical protein
MKAKPTKAQVEARVDEILRIRLDGAEIWDVREYVREKEVEDGSPWKLAEGQKPLSDSQLWRYIARADKAIAESCRASRKKLLRRHLAQRRNLFGKALSAGDYRAALAAVESEARLQGLFDTTARPAKLDPIKTPEDVSLLLAEAVADLRAGRLDTKTAAAVGALAAGWLRAAEFGDLAKRLEALEEAAEAAKAQNGRGRWPGR